ncbi:YmdB family metallophosphoesterase [Candidatus Dojkabacteria bacterium]|nr:YmdB family metallophosphoesterase [Candidatus Dojkabacteria bacterium]
MKILFLGDICGENARKVLADFIPEKRKTEGIDLVIANAENAAHGKGITTKIAVELKNCGIDVMTSGNHIFKQPDFWEILTDSTYQIIRPMNYPDTAVGVGSIAVDTPQGKVLVINIMGEDFINERTLVEPFVCFEKYLETIDPKEYIAIIVDFHAEATAEKKAFGLYFDGKVSAILGTHTHVQTADEEILPQKTAYITDVGTVGPKDSVLWAQKEIIFDRMMLPYPQRFEISDDSNIIVNGVIVDTLNSQSSNLIKRINEVRKAKP